MNNLLQKLVKFESDNVVPILFLITNQSKHKHFQQPIGKL